MARWLRAEYVTLPPRASEERGPEPNGGGGRDAHGIEAALPDSPHVKAPVCIHEETLAAAIDACMGTSAIERRLAVASSDFQESRRRRPAGVRIEAGELLKAEKVLAGFCRCEGEDCAENATQRLVSLAP